MANYGFSYLAEHLLQHARRTPDKRAFVCDGVPLTYAELVKDALACAAQLKAAGFVSGGDNRVGLLSPSSLDAVVLLAACQIAGITFVPLPLLIASDALARMIVDAQITHLFFDFAKEEQARAAADVTGAPPVLISINAPGSPILGNWLTGDVSPYAPGPIEPQWASDIIYSSGTTGVPKGIVQSFQARTASCVSLARLGINSETNFLHTVGPYSNFGMVGMLLSMWWGGSYFMMRKFDGAAAVTILRDEHIDMAWFAPATLIRTIDIPGFDDAVEGKPCVKLCAGAPLSPVQKQEVLRRWPGNFYDLYGQTGTGTLTLLSIHAAPADKLGSVGQLLPTVDVLILDEAGIPVPAGTEGEITAHADSMMTGYHQREDANASAIWRDEQGKVYLRTGDIGRIDDDGYLWLCDRKKDMILSGGLNIYPADIERVFADHPAVFEAAAVGCPSAKWGETPVAFVTLKQGECIPDEELRGWVNARLGPAQRVAIVRIVEQLPNGAMGKILKRELRDSLVKELGILP